MYTWNHSEAFAQSKACFYEKSNPMDRFYFQMGKVVEKDDFILNFSSKASIKYLEKFDYIPSNTASPIVSSLLMEFLRENTNESFQEIPIKIIANDGNLSDFFLINIIKIIDAIDDSKSIKFQSSGTYQKIFYKSEADVGSFLARSKNSLSAVLVSSKLKEKIQKEKFKGLNFILAESF